MAQKGAVLLKDTLSTSKKKEGGAIYKWVDKNGVFHLSSFRPKSKEKVEVVQTAAYREEPPLLDVSPPLTKKKSKKKSKKKRIKNKKLKDKVVIYTATWCGFCKQAVAFLRSRNIPFKEYDIDKDKGARAKMRAAGGKGGVPFAIINGQKILGFDKEGYQRALQLR